MSLFVIDDGKSFLPIAVFSRVTPERHLNFLLHIMLVLGEYDTELELWNSQTIREALAKAKLIPSNDHHDRNKLNEYSLSLMARIVNKILPLQPVSMKGLDRFITKMKELLDAVVLDDSMPLTELPACIATELYNDKSKNVSY